MNSSFDALVRSLGLEYSALAIQSPKDSVEHFINDKLNILALELQKDEVSKTIAEKKLSYFLTLSKEQRYALAVRDMQKRHMPIPSEYRHLQDHNKKRDYITSNISVTLKIAIASVLSFIAGLYLG